jgi:hypothetical protein
MRHSKPFTYLRDLLPRYGDEGIEPAAVVLNPPGRIRRVA